MIDAFVLEKIESILKYCLNNHLPFFTYRLPNSDFIKIGIQKDLNLMSFQNVTDLQSKQGFVMAPFDSNDKYTSWFIREDIGFSSENINEEEIQNLNRFKNELDFKENGLCIESSESDYFSQLDEILETLKGKSLKKAILSRIQIEKNDKSLDSPSLFVQLCQYYPKAFVSFVSLPGICSWMGASPELLLKSENNKTETVALAGTLPVSSSNLSDIEWGAKEIEEQAFVSDYIETVFKDNSIDKFEKKGPFTVKAGQVAHLKTEFKIERNLSFEDKAKMITALHPTPAVCGLPKLKALDLIKAVETHDREYYAGYWGPLEANGDFALYVNLRTMKITENQLSLFVGGGITADSIPQKEWEETQHKAQTLLSVIKACKLS
ncbi:isochorismate synthase [Ancylomarina euxinus]|uniref:isochorismate synthase n=1 Tax=Ancylomarina euxinus TaxID=2283627 RepID=A0A425Y1R5_9BACT|nr:isochorismate synthase [Ancylomarina euxinus]MCZ4695170.1 isochorismate synthase [Ancylomarina euxinus]MUP14896.1 isochorismate synthase [Ancylomarina euxinus]RRG21791.1 isochorismate synthase [Ancylomarina euxinus]